MEAIQRPGGPEATQAHEEAHERAQAQLPRPLLDGFKRAGFQAPTPIQARKETSDSSDALRFAVAPFSGTGVAHSRQWLGCHRHRQVPRQEESAVSLSSYRITEDWLWQDPGLPGPGLPVDERQLRGRYPNPDHGTHEGAGHTDP